MIFTERTITVRKGTSTINESIILYRGDFEVGLKFTILDSKYKFLNGSNLIESEKATYAQLAVLKPKGDNIFSDVVKCSEGSVTFKMTKEMIDGLEEVGKYSFQIRLFDSNRESRVSIPPVEFGIEVREPIASEDHNNEVNEALTGYSITKVTTLKDDIVDTFDGNGNYNKTNWETGDRITENKLNKVEDAIDKLNNKDKTLDTKINSNLNILETKLSLKSDTTYVDRAIAAVASGSPKGTYATLSALKAAIPRGDSNIYVVSEDGGWYYWNGSTWTKGGQYQSTGIGDNTVSYASLNTQLKAWGSNIASVTIHGYNTNLQDTPSGFINVDTKRKVIQTTQDMVITTVDLSGKKYKGSLPKTEVSYNGFSTGCIHLIVNTNTWEFKCISYMDGLQANEIILATIRYMNGGFSDRYDVTFDGKASIGFRKLTESVLSDDPHMFYGAVPEYKERMIFVIDPVKNKMIIPAGSLIAGNKTYTLTSDIIDMPSNTARHALYYNTVDKKVKCTHASEYQNSRNNILIDFFFYQDLSIHTTSFTKDRIIVDGIQKINYIDIKDSFNLKKLRFAAVSNKYTKLYSKDTFICITDNQGYNTKSYNRFRLGHKDRDGVVSDVIQIKESDGISKIIVDMKNPDYKYAYHITQFTENEDGSLSHSWPGDTGWKTGRFVFDVKKWHELYGPVLYVSHYVARVDDSASALVDLTDNLLVDIEIITNQDEMDSGTKVEPNIRTDNEGIKIEETQGVGKHVRNRAVLASKIPFTANMFFTSKNIKTHTYNGITRTNVISIHGYNDSGVRIFDSNWQYAGVIENYNPIENWDTRYTTAGFGAGITKEDVLTELSYINIFHYCDGDFTSTDEYKSYLESIEFTYGVREASTKDKCFNWDKAANYALMASYKGVTSSNGESTNILSLDGEFKINYGDKLPDMKSITIPKGYRAFNVEFTARVEGSSASVKVDNQTINIYNTRNRRYKFRLNKSTESIKIVKPVINVTTNSMLIISDIRITPIKEDIQVLPHTNNRFYMHRGYSTEYPENTLLAAEEACKHGCSMIELDLFTSIDGKPLMVHDNTTGRTDMTRKTITISDTTSMTRVGTNKITLTSSIIKEFAVNDYITITDSNVDKTATVTAVNGNTITVNITNLSGTITKIVNNRRLVSSMTEAEFLNTNAGSSKFPDEYNASFDDYLNVLSRYNASILFDIRSMTETCFKESMKPLIDRYKYWDNIYYMHGVTAISNYDRWAGDIGRKIRTAAILWSTGDALINEIKKYGDTKYNNTISKDIVIQSSAVTPEVIELAHSYGMRVMAFTVNSLSIAQDLLRMGVDIIASDCLSDDNCSLW